MAAIRKHGTAIVAILSAAILFIAPPPSAGAEDSQGGIVFGDGWAFLAMAPEGWVWDPISMRNHGIQGLYYKAGSRFSPTELHMYVSPSPKKGSASRTLKEFVAADEAAFVEQYRGLSIKRLPPRETGPGYSFVRLELDDAGTDYYQELAYYEGEACFFAIVLSCRSVQEREREIGAFEELLDSFICIKKEQ